MSGNWKTINTMAEYRRYNMQPGVNVFAIKEPIADPKETADVENSIFQAFQEQAQNNRVRFYKSDVKLSDGGGGLQVWYNGTKVEHKALLPGALNPVGDAVRACLEKEG